MGILYVFGVPIGLGGHFRSALAMVKYISKKGIKFFAIAPGGSQEMLEEYRAEGCDMIIASELSRFNPFLNLSSTKAIIIECRKRSIDIIHSQDFRSLYPSYLAATVLKKGFVFTRAGRHVVQHIPPRNVEIVVFSEELLDGMIRQFNLSKDNISLIRARIDLSCYSKKSVSGDFAEKYHLPTSGKRIVMAMRLIKAKRPWLQTMLRLAEHLSRENMLSNLIIAGDGPLSAELKRQADRINNICGKKYIHFIGPIFNIKEMNQLYHYADLVIGHGRGILEAMACRKPVVVLGENGRGEVVDENTVSDVAKSNFSGRHLRHKDVTFMELLSTIKAILQDEVLPKDLGDFSYRYVKSEMDAEIGASQLYDVYSRAINRTLSWRDCLRWHTATLLNNSGKLFRVHP